MSYLHCHTKNCGWSQDDFWDEHYTPLRPDIMKSLSEDLFKERIYFDKSMFVETGDLPYHLDEEGKAYCRGSDYVAWDLRKRAKRIQNMLVKTYAEFKANKDKLVCPRCGQQNWDID